jgi:hypothetical protein
MEGTCPMTERKKTGLCTVCDDPVFLITAKYTEGPRKGEAAQVGRSLPGVRRVFILRMSGSHSFWTVCPVCEISILDMPRLHRKELAAMVMERNLAKDTMKQAEARARMLKLLQWDAPLGVLGEKPWSEVQ